jgi:hypothetical protein
VRRSDVEHPAPASGKRVSQAGKGRVMLRLRLIARDGAAPAVAKIVPEFRDPYLELLRLLR